MEQEKDPVRKSEAEGIRPGFLKGRKGGATSVLNAAEDAAKDTPSPKTGSSGTSAIQQAVSAEGGAASGLYRRAQSTAGGATTSKNKMGMKIKKTAPALVAVILLLLVPVLILPSIPMFVIGAIDYNLQNALGFADTAALLEDIGANVVSETLGDGKFPSALAGDFAKAGITVGQVTANGNFVRTNEYIANIDDTLEVAATGLDYNRYGSEGELAVLFDGEVIKAEDFVLAVESNPRLYAAYSEGLDIVARFYYSDDVAKVYKELEIDTAAFANWSSTGDFDKDLENYRTALDKILSDSANSNMGGCESSIITETTDDGKTTAEKGTGSCVEAAFDKEKAVSEVINAAGNGPNATHKASQLLNMAISSTEPRKAAKAFMAVEEPIQRARMDGAGPINEVMTTLTEGSSVEYIDVHTQEKKTVTKPILETTNFVAAVSQGTYSQDEADNFSRDRVMIATGTINDGQMGSVISGSSLNDEQSKSTEAVLERNDDGESPDAEAVSKAQGSIDLAKSEFNSEEFMSVIGGNRAISGGSYLSSKINQTTLAGMPSDEETIATYQHEVATMLARKAEAERATLSPFDISSPNTFLGSIVHNFAMAYVRSSAFNETEPLSAMGAMIGATQNATDGLFGDAMADGDNDYNYATLKGNCATVNQAANVVGDIYCNSHSTLTTKYFDYTMDDWKNVMGGDIDDAGKPAGKLAEFVTYGMDRDATVGVKSSYICEQYHDAHDSWWDKIWGSLKDLLGVYVACDDVPAGTANGSSYTLSTSNPDLENTEKYSGYVLYDTVRSLINGEQSSVSAFREEYYNNHPKDDSAAGKIARMSGMTKAEAEIALGYAAYLAMVNSYDASSRYAFGGSLKVEQPVIAIDDSGVKEMVYAYYQGKIKFADLRGRNQAA